MATTTTLGKVSLTMGGNYSPTATYDRLTVVRGVSGNSYVTTVDGVSGISPGVTSGWENYWQLFAADGEGGGGGGSNVVVTPILTSGTKIATITVDGTGSDLYAPNGGGGGTVTDVQVNGVSVLDEDGVADVPVASNSSLGVVKTQNNYGILVHSTEGRIYIDGANASVVKTGTDQFRPITPSRQHDAAFYGLAKAAGDTTQASSSNPVGTYTDGAKGAIKTMLGVGDGVTVSGTTATVTDLSGVDPFPTGGAAGDVLELGENGPVWSSDVTDLKSAVNGKISAPSSPTAGQFLVYDGSAWVAQTVPAANGVNF